jgi:hypothetical protein
MSQVDGLPPGWARIFSRVAAIAALPFVVTSLQMRSGGFAFLAIAITVAFESNCHCVDSIVRLLAVVTQVLGLLAFAGLVVMLAGLAEAGHRGYEYMSGVLWLVLAGLWVVGLVATVGAARTLRLSRD